MTDNRDIDEILASLDALLREGDSHNDDMPVESTSASVDIDALEAALETDLKSVEASVKEAPDANEVGEDLPVEAVFDEIIDPQEASLSRVVLTEDMMVENPQVSLPLGFNSETESEDNLAVDEPAIATKVLSDNVENVMQDGVQETSHDETMADIPVDSGSSEHVMRLHKQEVEQLLSLVSQDVSEHLQQMLPQLIKESLHAHLADMQHDSENHLNENNKMSDDK